VVVTAALAACSSDDTNATPPDLDSSVDGTTDTGAGLEAGPEAAAEAGDDATQGDSGDAAVSLVARGAYLVNHVGACGDCHTPRLQTGEPDTTRFLAGTPNLFQVPGLGPDGGIGIVGTKNLTPDTATGLGSWTDAQIKNAFLNGVDKDNKALFPIMPYFVLHNMTDSDADAIVAYLRSIPAVSQTIPPRNFDFAQPAMPVPASALPNPTLQSTDADYASAMRGKYLAANIGVCMECHTQHVNGPVPLDVNKLFAGGDDFPSAALGLPVPPFPAVIFSENITPSASGLAGWAPSNVVDALKSGIDKSGVHLCPPMPAGPAGAFGGLTDGDALDLANYVTHLPPIDNTVSPICHQVMNADAGATDAATDASTDASTDAADAGDGG
jgi:mono/diheme cytochrome c family protein